MAATRSGAVVDSSRVSAADAAKAHVDASVSLKVVAVVMVPSAATAVVPNGAAAAKQNSADAINNTARASLVMAAGPAAAALNTARRPPLARTMNQLSAQGLFPPTREQAQLDIALQHKAYFTDGILNPRVPAQLQLIGCTSMATSESVGCDSPMMSRCAAMVLANVIEADADARARRGVDFRAYSLNFMDAALVGVVFGNPDASSKDTTMNYWQTDAIQNAIESWTRDMLAQYYYYGSSSSASAGSQKKGGGRVFRRSLIICFDALFCKYAFADRCGHAITLAIEIRASNPHVVRVFIFDNISIEYLYNVHDQLFEWIVGVVELENHHDAAAKASAASAASAAAAEPQLITTRETVCMRRKLHTTHPFMMCMSVAYRVSVFLSRILDADPALAVRESQADFENSTRFLSGEMFRMINWLDANADVVGLKTTPIVSRAMAQTYYELSTRTCFLYLLPYDLGEQQPPPPPEEQADASLIKKQERAFFEQLQDLLLRKQQQQPQAGVIRALRYSRAHVFDVVAAAPVSDAA